MKKLIGTFLVMLLVVASVSAQMTEWTWSTYKVKFNAPKNMKVTQNDAKAFIGSTGNVTLSIYPRKGENLSYDGMQTSLTNWAKSNALVDYHAPEYIDDLNGYWGVYLEGYKNNFPVFQMLAIDPDYPDISLYIWISYAESDIDIAEQILMSFTPQ